MKPTTGLRDRLRHAGTLDDADMDLAETALLLASAERPGIQLDPYRRHLARMAEEVAAYAGAEAGMLEMRLEALRRVIARRYGYGGDDDELDEWDGANLMRVMDLRTGLPAVLAIIYLDVCRRLGWAVDAVDFPARVLVRMDHGGRRAIIDPFDGGRETDPREMRELLKAVVGNEAELTPEHYRSLGNRALLVKVQNGIKLRLLRAERLAEALDVAEGILLFAPGESKLWREVGLLHARLEQVKEAVAALEEYMRRNTGDSARYRTSVLLQELRERLS